MLFKAFNQQFAISMMKVKSWKLHIILQTEHQIRPSHAFFVLFYWFQICQTEQERPLAFSICMSCSILKTKLSHDFGLTSSVSNYHGCIISVTDSKKQIPNTYPSIGSDNKMCALSTITPISVFLFVPPHLLQTSKISPADCSSKAVSTVFKSYPEVKCTNVSNSSSKLNSTR